MHVGGPPVGRGSAAAADRDSQLSPSVTAADRQLPKAAAAADKLVAARAVSGAHPGGAAEMRSTRAGLASDVWSFGCLAYEVRLMRLMVFSPI